MRDAQFWSLLCVYFWYLPSVVLNGVATFLQKKITPVAVRELYELSSKALPNFAKPGRNLYLLRSRLNRPTLTHSQRRYEQSFVLPYDEPAQQVESGGADQSVSR